MLIAAGLVVTLVLTAATGYFVAQEFAYMAVESGQAAAVGRDRDKPAQRALRVTQKLSFMLSGAQFGITVTALLVGYVARRRRRRRGHDRRHDRRRLRRRG